MSAMADLDITLTDLKLSDAQKNALVEVHTASGDNSKISARKNTLNSLVSRDLIREIGGTWTTTPAGREALGIPVVEVIEEELNTNMWDAPAITDEEIDIFKDMTDKLSGVEDEDAQLQAYTFDKDWAMWERELCGFEATIGWKNTDVWDGLTAEEIREDMDTALPIGRKARRERARLVRKVLAAV